MTENKQCPECGSKNVHPVGVGDFRDMFCICCGQRNHKEDFDAQVQSQRLLDSMEEPFHSSVIASDGMADGGEPYTDAELAFIAEAEAASAAGDKETAFYRGHEHHPNNRPVMSPRRDRIG